MTPSNPTVLISTATKTGITSTAVSVEKIAKEIRRAISDISVLHINDILEISTNLGYFYAILLSEAAQEEFDGKFFYKRQSDYQDKAGVIEELLEFYFLDAVLVGVEEL